LVVDSSVIGAMPVSMTATDEQCRCSDHRDATPH
jgi:hypothetical protein